MKSAVLALPRPPPAARCRPLPPPVARRPPPRLRLPLRCRRPAVPQSSPGRGKSRDVCHRVVWDFTAGNVMGTRNSFRYGPVERWDRFLSCVGQRWMLTPLPPTAHRPPSTAHRPPSAVRRPPSTVYRPPSTARRPPSTAHRPPPTVHRPPPTAHRPPPAAHRPPSSDAVASPQSTVPDHRRR